MWTAFYLLSRSQIAVNLVPFPKQHFLVSAISPLPSPCLAPTPVAAFKGMFKPAAQTVVADPLQACYVAAAFIARGGRTSISEMRSWLRDMERQRTPMRMPAWNLDGFTCQAGHVPGAGRCHGVLVSVCGEQHVHAEHCAAGAEHPQIFLAPLSGLLNVCAAPSSSVASRRLVGSTASPQTLAARPGHLAPRVDSRSLLLRCGSPFESCTWFCTSRWPHTPSARRLRSATSESERSLTHSHSLTLSFTRTYIISTFSLTDESIAWCLRRSMRARQASISLVAHTPVQTTFRRSFGPSLR
jgi:hypothetical protein